MTIKTLDLFSGIGGFRSGLERVGGFSFTGWCEINKYAQMAYRALYNTEGEYFCDDVTKIDTDELPEIDLITAGFPCQPFAVCGKRLGFDDTRGTLFHEIARVAKAKHPAYILLENVPGLAFHENGQTLRYILSSFHELGYTLEFSIVDSKKHGVPQQRHRLYIVGYLDDRCAGKIFPLEGSYGKACKQVIPGPQGARVYSTKGAAVTQTAGGGGSGAKTGLYFIDMNADAKVTDNARCITAHQDGGISKRKGEHSGVLIEDGPRAIISPSKENTRQNGRRVKTPDEAMFTLTATDRHGVVHKGRVRKLMPIECWRLQGFTDEQFYAVAALGISDSQLYKMAGNSVTVNVISAIAEKINGIHHENSIGEPD